MKKFLIVLLTLINSIVLCAQINTDRVTLIGRNALYFEDYVLAIQYFNQVIKAKPYLAEPYYYRAIAKYYLDDFKGAEDDCTSCLDRNPFMSSVNHLRAEARQNQKKYDQALEDYKITLNNKPNDKFVLINMGIANMEKKDYDEAEKNLNQLVSQSPNYVQGILTRASLYLEKGDTIKGLEDIAQAISKDSYFAPSYSMRASVLLNQKKYDGALIDLDEAIKLDPLLTGNYINRGLTKYYLTDLRGAMLDYDHVIKLDPQNIIAHLNRAILRAQVRDDNRAIKDFDFVIQHEPENYIAYMNRAIIKNNIADTKGALSDLNVVLDKYPEFYQGYYIRSEIKRKKNELKSAEQDYLHARRLEAQAQQKSLAEKGSNKKDGDKKTREKSDKDIDKFNLLVTADKKEEEDKKTYSREIRGKVQDKQVKIELASPFVVTYYEKGSELRSIPYYNKEIQELNKKNVLSRKLIITNQEVPLDSTQIEIHFASINEYSRLIQDESKDPILYYARGLDFMMIQDISSAIEDFNKATALDPKFTLAYYSLAVAYTKLAISREVLPELYQQELQKEKRIDIASMGTAKPNTPAIAQPEIIAKDVSVKLNYELIFKNYDKVTELSPNFTFAYYNRAEIRSIQNDYRAAILDYNEAIRQDDEFAEAFYNRGLNRLHIKETDRGLDDLRKAGELGIIGAYSIIKKMTE